MSLPSGTRLGPYKIEAPIGAGGMGEVYRATDTRLARTVAVKILPPHLNEKPHARQRFDREARAISSLQHPSICTLHDVGHQDGIDFLVMEYLKGETLADRISKGPLPRDQLLKYGMEICAGLDKAHCSGVVHRDLKPGNIILTKSGAKLLDFGLAKPMDAAPAVSLTALPTSSKAADASPAKPLTAEGSIVGTFQYMSPEQIEGREADERSDIFALGAVLYEMATGKRAFDGKSRSSVIAAILERDPPPISQLQPMSPPVLDRVVKVCLAKEPDDRWQSAHDVELELKWIAEGGLQAGTGAPAAAMKHSRAALTAWTVAAICFLAAIALAAVIYLRAPQPAIRSSLLPPAGSSYVSNNFAVSPDGSRLAFVATDSSGDNSLWVRSLSAPAAQHLTGTEDAAYPFWSPDSRSIGFFAQGKLKIVDLAGSAAKILADAPAGRGGSWNRDGVIVFASNLHGPLDRISAEGGLPIPVTQIARAGSGQAHRWPFFLPDGRHFLYFVDWSNGDDTQQNGIYVGSLGGGAPKLRSSQLAGNVSYASGYLLYVLDRSLMAQPFDPTRLETTGPPIGIAEQEMQTDTGFSNSGYSVSQNGVLVFESLADSSSQLEWFSATGRPLGKIAGLGHSDPSISPDGRYLAVTSDDEHNGKLYIRTIDLNRGISTRLTEGGVESTPMWSRDGKQIVYDIGTGGSGNFTSISQVAADASGHPQDLIKGAGRISWGSWSPDGHFVFSDFSSGFPFLEVYSAADKSIQKLGVQGAEARFSPNGKWIAYTRIPGEIAVQSFPGPGPRTQISDHGGGQPVWSRDGMQLFYIAPDKTLMAVNFDPQKGTASSPRGLFKTRIIAAAFVGTQYDVAPDGRFLINSLPADHSSPLTLLSNWTSLIKSH